MIIKVPALVVGAVLLLLALGFATAADEDPLQDFCIGLPPSDTTSSPNGLLCKPAASVQSSDFASSQLRKPASLSGHLGSALNLANALTFGALHTQSLSIARIDFNPRGINPPHVHPRATEVLFLAQGTLLVGFVSSGPANQFFNQTISEGDLFVFPRGLVHFQFNPDESKPALAIAALNSQNPGASQVAATLFSANPPLSNDVLEAALGVGGDELQHLMASVQTTLK